MNKSELVAAIADKADISKAKAELALTTLTDTISYQLQKGEAVTLVGFGTFSVKEREARQGRNPQSGESILIPARRVPGFKAGANLKDAVN
ncbi:HU family DNA-binding protein [Marinobacter sp.]|uniref:HU family DNA-binding protein n=1 Tax=Marinobacter sp. TaxID=50741 RepID=UPI003A8EB968